MTTATTALEELARLRTEHSEVAQTREAAYAHRRECEQAIPRLEREWQNALTDRARGRTNGGQEADELGQRLGQARTELETAVAESEAGAVAVRQIEQEIAALYLRELPEFVEAAHELDLDVRAAAHTAAMTLQALRVAWSRSAEEWAPMHEALAEHVRAREEQSGIIRGNLTVQCSPRRFPDAFAAAIGLLQAVERGVFGPHPAPLDGVGVEPDVSVNLEPAIREAEAALEQDR